MNVEFSSTCRRKNYSLFHWNTLILWGLLILIRTSLKKTYWQFLQCRFEQTLGEICSTEREASNGVHVVREEIDEDSDDSQIRLIFARRLDGNRKSRSESKRKRNGQGKNLSSTMLEDWQEFILLIQTTKNIRKLSKIRGENWKDQWHPPRRAREFSLAPRKWLQSLRLGMKRGPRWCIVEKWNLMNPRDNERNLESKNPWRSHCWKRIFFDDTFQIGAQVFPDATSNENSKRQICYGRGMEKARHDSSMECGKSRARRRLFFKHKETTRKSTLPRWWTYVTLKNPDLNPNLQKYKGRVVLRERHCRWRLWSARIILFCKIMEVIARLPSCNGQAVDEVCALPRKIAKMLPDCSKFRNLNVLMFGYAHGKNHCEKVKILWYFLNEHCTVLR